MGRKEERRGKKGEDEGEGKTHRCISRHGRDVRVDVQQVGPALNDKH